MSGVLASRCMRLAASRRRRRRLLSLLLALLLLVPAACGGGGGGGAKGTMSREEYEKEEAEAAARRAKQTEQKLKPQGRVELDIASFASEQVTAWNDRVKEPFETFYKHGLASSRDIFVAQADTFKHRPELPEVEGEPVTAAAVPKPGDKPAEVEDLSTLEPIRRFPLKDYKLVMIMSGTAFPNAVVVPPDGRDAIIVKVDDVIGLSKGVVKAITQYEVVVADPSSGKEHRMSIKPAFIDLDKKQGRSMLTTTAPGAADRGGQDEDEPVTPRTDVRSLLLPDEGASGGTRRPASLRPGGLR